MPVCYLIVHFKVQKKQRYVLCTFYRVCYLPVLEVVRWSNAMSQWRSCIFELISTACKWRLFVVSMRVSECERCIYVQVYVADQQFGRQINVAGEAVTFILLSPVKKRRLLFL